jgi:hypothetical protein
MKYLRENRRPYTVTYSSLFNTKWTTRLKSTLVQVVVLENQQQQPFKDQNVSIACIATFDFWERVRSLVSEDCVRHHKFSFGTLSGISKFYLYLL